VYYDKKSAYPMDLIAPVSAEGRTSAGRFRRGRSGNPRGRPKGAKSLLAAKLDRMAEREAPVVLEKVLAQAKGGDLDAAKLILSRAWPARKGRPVRLPVPSEASPMTIITAALQAVVGGRLTPEEAEGLASLVEAAGKAIDAEAIRRIEALDAEPKPRPRLAA
jgi:hypothetical protein